MRHTGVNIATAINNILVEFNLMDKTLALTTDNTSAMLVCGRTLANNLNKELDSQAFHHYWCTAHVLNLAAHHGLEIIDQEIGNIRSLMSKLKNSPELDIATRWNSTYYMLKKMIRMQGVLRMLAINHDDIQNLMPKAETLSKIEDYIKNNKFNQYMLAASISEKIKEYETIIDDATTVATILDPGTKLSLFEIGYRTTKAIDQIREIFDKYSTSDKLTHVSSNIVKDDTITTCDYFCELK
ncbi:7053_t:CDS:2 [Cetraspora pellucida]|uniref:7053_t:CDS:1 n=1 Tax=Cetraspora pellucida TaxID=1433469 RepID=A0A9N9EQR5_9GLOM|nr:7053_t:CDS:2 [Cetraspora pellucida]